MCVWSAPSRHLYASQTVHPVIAEGPMGLSLALLPGGVEWEKGLLLEMELPAKLLADQLAHCVEQS